VQITGDSRPQQRDRAAATVIGMDTAQRGLDRGIQQPFQRHETEFAIGRQTGAARRRVVAVRRQQSARRDRLGSSRPVRARAVPDDQMITTLVVLVTVDAGWTNSAVAGEHEVPQSARGEDVAGVGGQAEPIVVRFGSVRVRCVEEQLGRCHI